MRTSSSFNAFAVITAIALAALATSTSALSQVNIAFTSGTVSGAGFPGPLVNNSGNVSANMATGGGSTGGGIGSALATVRAFSPNALRQVIEVTGTAQHNNANGFTAALSSSEILFSIDRASRFWVRNASTVGAAPIIPANLRSITTGAIIATTGTLPAGNYGVNFAVWTGNTSAVPGTYPGKAAVPAGNYLNASAHWELILIATTACRADFNGVNGVTVQDIFDFLAAWFAGDVLANFNQLNAVTVQDIFDFLAAWFAACP